MQNFESTICTYADSKFICLPVSIEVRNSDLNKRSILTSILIYAISVWACNWK